MNNGEPARGRTTVVLVDDHALIRDGLRRAFDRDGGFDVVGEASSVAEGRERIERLAPQVVVLDVGLPDGKGTDLAREIRAARRDIGIVVLTMYSGDDQVFTAMEAGASAFVNKDAPAEDVVAAARHAAANPWAFSAKDLVGAMQRRLAGPTGPRLSPREKEVLDLLVDGLAIGQISRRLYISESTTKTHVAKIYDKLGASNRAQAVVSAIRLGLVAGR